MDVFRGGWRKPVRAHGPTEPQTRSQLKLIRRNRRSPEPARGWRIGGTERAAPHSKLDGLSGFRLIAVAQFMDAERNDILVAIIMGSRSDWDTMQHAAAQLEALSVPWEAKALSAHRAPDALFEYLAGAPGRGVEVVIAAAGGAAHLPGVCAAKCALPVLGVPMESASLKGMDSLLSIVQMPGGIPVGTLAIGKPGAINAALLAVSILGLKYPEYRKAYAEFRRNQTAKVLAESDLRLPEAPAKKS
jgi:5-(carboxyamino)imidazole ribonucleotide mutase